MPRGMEVPICGFSLKEVEREDGRKELVLVEDPAKIAAYAQTSEEDDAVGVTNTLNYQQRLTLSKNRSRHPCLIPTCNG